VPVVKTLNVLFYIVWKLCFCSQFWGVEN
jgi:hypothetical protein